MSVYESLRKQLLESGGKYEDPDFPADKSSLYIGDDRDEDHDSMEWKRPHVSDNLQLHYFRVMG